MNALKIEIGNIHCKQCESFIKDILSNFFTFRAYLNDETDFSIGNEIKHDLSPGTKGILNDDSLMILRPFMKLKAPNQPHKIEATGFIADLDAGLITVTYDSERETTDVSSLLRKVKDALENSGFDVEDAYFVTDVESAKSSYTSGDSSHLHEESRDLFQWLRTTFFSGKVQRKRYRAHLSHCQYCQNDKSVDQTTDSNDASKKAQNDNTIYQSTIAISGMTCASCSQTVEATIRQHLHEHESVHVDLLNNVAKVTTTNKQSVQKIISSVRDSGYDARLIDILPITTESRFKITAAIGGITCAACASTISSVTKELDFVEDVAINVVSKVGIFILDSEKAERVEDLKEAIEDAGYDFEIIGKIKRISHASAKRSHRTVTLRIDGMFCNHCPERIKKVLKRFGGLIINSDITLKHPYVKFSYVPNVETGVTIRGIIDSILKDVADNSDNNFRITIVKELSLEEHLKKMAKKSTREILIRLTITTIFAIPTFIFGVVGMALLKPENKFRMWLMMPLWHGNASRVVWILLILSTPVYFFMADIFHRKAIKEIKTLWIQKNNWRRRLFKFGSMSLLMSLGTTVAYFASIALLALSATQPYTGHRETTSYFDSVVFLTFFLLIGRLLESISKSKTAAAINNLGSMKQHYARLIEKIDGQTVEKTIDVQYIEAGDYIKVSPGESPPSDCIIIEGNAQFDESALTGESIPVEHKPGEQIFAGTVNVGRSSVLGKLVAVEGDSLLDQIVNTVRDGQLKRAPVEKLADALTGYFVPIIVLLAVATWTIWLGLGYGGKLPESYLDVDVGGWAVWSLEFAISVFVVACPCGIGLAAPTAILVGAGLAAKYGILAKGGGAAFQDGSNVSVVCFDKTGTLTKGGAPQVAHFAIHNNPRVRSITPQLTRDLEANSKHPLAIGVRNFINEYFGGALSTNKVPVTEEVPGLGITGEIVCSPEEYGKSIWDELKAAKVILGNERFMAQNKVHMTTHQLQLLDEWKTEGNSVVIVALQCPALFQNSNFFPILLLGAKDEVREEAKGVIKSLQEEGIECWMISGDNEKTARSIANELGIDQVVAEVLPAEKAEKVQWIQTTYKKNGKPAVVAMVGDGINDAPAMSKADVGIALASGSDLAVISCDFVLLSSVHTLSSLLTLFQLSRKVFGRVKFNFGWALIYNLVAVPIAAGVIYPYKHSRLSPVWASAAMALSSISVIISSLALRLFRPSKVSLTNQVQKMQTAIEHTFR